jgi:hypothetical protein
MHKEIRASLLIQIGLARSSLATPGGDTRGYATAAAKGKRLIATDLNFMLARSLSGDALAWKWSRNATTRD